MTAAPAGWGDLPRTPFFGPYDQTRSTNFADNACINLRPEISDVKSAARGIGALYGTAGLALLSEVGAGPVNGMRPLGGSTLYVVSNLGVYTIGLANWGATLVFSPLASAGNVSRVGMTDNGVQILIATDTHVYVGPVGFPLTNGNILAGGANYALGDQIVLGISGAGTQTAAAIIEVTGVAGTAVTGFTVLQTGAFSSVPALLEQTFTTGSGSGFQLNALVFGGTQALCDVFLPFTPILSTFPMYPTFQDDFALINQRGTKVQWQSLNLDISVWPPLNFAYANGESDNIQVMASIHREVVVIKERSTEVWNNAGTAGFAFQPLSATLIETGTGAPASAAKVGESLIWLNQSSQGAGTVVQMDGFATKKISTYAVENVLNDNIAMLSQSFGYSYQQEGHQYYVLTVIEAGITFVYDKTGSDQSGVPIWFQWLYYNTGSGQFERHRGNAYAFFNDTCVLGDYANGNLYAIDLDTLTDNETTRKWQRSWRALAEPIYAPVRFSSLQLDMQTGVGVVTPAPTVELEWSDDGGHTFSTPLSRGCGASGDTDARVFWTRLGSTRRNSGLDRIFRVSSTSQFQVCLINAELDLQ